MYCILAAKWTIPIAHLPPSFGRSRQIYTIVLQTDTGRSADDRPTDKPRYTYYISITIDGT